MRLFLVAVPDEALDAAITRVQAAGYTAHEVAPVDVAGKIVVIKCDKVDAAWMLDWTPMADALTDAGARALIMLGPDETLDAVSKDDLRTILDRPD